MGRTGIDRATAAALIEALQDEYRARATYRSVIEAFGPVRPFINIVESEDRHVAALLRHFDRLGLKPPTDEWNERVRPPRSLEDACSAAVRAEMENAVMYERLRNQVEDVGVRRTLSRLQEASQRHHLRAFQRCRARMQANQS